MVGGRGMEEVTPLGGEKFQVMKGVTT